LDSNLRYGAEYKTRVWDAPFSFARNGGMDVAIEQCNGQGVCRKDTGVMCPSFQATREEMHSTRGRANLLRAFIVNSSLVTGRSSLEESVAQALDLCLACKGCKGECPSGVDMAKLKFAFQSEYYKTHRRQLRDYAFGYFHRTAGLAASIAPISNALMGIPAIRNLAAKILGITPHRPIPKFSSRRAKIVATKAQSRGERKRVIFLSDAFARYIEPETEQAALDILSRSGYDAQVLPILGAGASFLSKGFIDQARDHAARVLDLLNQVDPASELPIVGIEPPEIYEFKHDYLDLLPERAEEIRKRVANVWLLDEFLLRASEFKDLRIVSLQRWSESEKNSPAMKVHFHPHCHQRAEGPSSDGLPNGTTATIELLRSCGYDVELMDTGCCGMAGTFGYEAEHYELSMKVGELKVFPTIRELTRLNDETLNLQSSTLAPHVIAPQRHHADVANRKSAVVSSGAACRMQIRQGTGVEAIHPIVLVAQAIGTHNLS
jgi:Fe-S oxidoreductase